MKLLEFFLVIVAAGTFVAWVKSALVGGWGNGFDRPFELAALAAAFALCVAVLHWMDR